MNNISSLLTRINLEIIAIISEESLSLRDIASRLRCSVGKVHQAIKLFKQNGLVKTEKIKNRLIIKPDRNNPIYQKIKALINISKIINSKTYKRIKKIGIIGIYGSYAHGSDDKESDVDLLILTDRKELELREMIRELEKELSKKINPLILTRQKLNNLERENKEFYIRLKLTTTILNGDIFGWIEGYPDREQRMQSFAENYQRSYKEVKEVLDYLGLEI